MKNIQLKIISLSVAVILLCGFSCGGGGRHGGRQRCSPSASMSTEERMACAREVFERDGTGHGDTWGITQEERERLLVEKRRIQREYLDGQDNPAWEKPEVDAPGIYTEGQLVGEDEFLIGHQKQFKIYLKGFREGSYKIEVQSSSTEVFCVGQDLADLSRGSDCSEYSTSLGGDMTASGVFVLVARPTKTSKIEQSYCAYYEDNADVKNCKTFSHFAVAAEDGAYVGLELLPLSNRGNWYGLRILPIDESTPYQIESRLITGPLLQIGLISDHPDGLPWEEYSDPYFLTKKREKLWQGKFFVGQQFIHIVSKGNNGGDWENSRISLRLTDPDGHRIGYLTPKIGHVPTAG